MTIDIASKMKEICAVALHAATDPMFVVVSYSKLAGVSEFSDEMSTIKRSAHEWLYQHQAEYPWRVKPPSDDKA